MAGFIRLELQLDLNKHDQSCLLITSVGEPQHANQIPNYDEQKKYASAGNRTRIYCLEGNNANLYTTDAVVFDKQN